MRVACLQEAAVNPLDSILVLLALNKTIIFHHPQLLKEVNESGANWQTNVQQPMGIVMLGATAAAGNDIVSVGVLLAAFGAFTLSLQSIAIRYGTVKARSSDALFVILVINAITFVPLAIFVGDSITDIQPTALVAFFAAGIIGIILGRAMHFQGIRRIGASRADAIKASQPLLAALIAVVVLDEVVTTIHLIGMVFIVAGVVFITIEYQDSSKPRETQLLDISFPLVAALAYGIEPIFVAVGLRTDISIWNGLAVMTVSGILAYSVYLRAANRFPVAADFTRRELNWFVFAGVLNTLFLVCYYVALRLEPVSVVVPIIQVSPLFVILISALFVRNDLERVTWQLVAASLFVVTGAIGVTIFRG